MNCSIFVSKCLALSAEARYNSKASRASFDVNFFLAEVEVADPSPRPHSRPESLSGDYFQRCCLLIKPLGRVYLVEVGVSPLPLGLV